jgi:hypothetical protein
MGFLRVSLQFPPFLCKDMMGGDEDVQSRVERLFSGVVLKMARKLLEFSGFLDLVEVDCYRFSMIFVFCSLIFVTFEWRTLLIPSY